MDPRIKFYCFCVPNNDVKHFNRVQDDLCQYIRFLQIVVVWTVRLRKCTLATISYAFLDNSGKTGLQLWVWVWVRARARARVWVWASHMIISYHFQNNPQVWVEWPRSCAHQQIRKKCNEIILCRESMKRRLKICIATSFFILFLTLLPNKSPSLSHSVRSPDVYSEPSVIAKLTLLTVDADKTEPEATAVSTREQTYDIPCLGKVAESNHTRCQHYTPDWVDRKDLGNLLHTRMDGIRYGELNTHFICIIAVVWSIHFLAFKCQRYNIGQAFTWSMYI